jgi:uncharacterized protein DUF3617
MRKLACLMLITMCAPVLAQEMEPGEWEFNTTMTAPGMPQAQTFTNKRCVTAKDSDPSRWADKRQGDCKVSPSKKSGGTYTWEVSCPSSGMRGTGTARVTRSTVESELRLAADMGGQKMEMLTKTTGKRLGACQK